MGRHLTKGSVDIDVLQQAIPGYKTNSMVDYLRLAVQRPGKNRTICTGNRCGRLAGRAVFHDPAIKVSLMLDF